MKPVNPEEHEFESSSTDLNQSFGNFLNIQIIRLPMPGRKPNVSLKKCLVLMEFLIENLSQELTPLFT